jgi:hypothetical protein
MYFYSNTYYNHDRLKSNFMGRKKLYSTPEELREHIKAYSKAYYEANREKRMAQAKSFYLANKDKLKDKRKAYNKAHYEANREKRMAQIKSYRLANKDKMRDYYRAYGKAHYKANIDKVKARLKAYRLANADKIKVTQKAYRAANLDKKNAYNSNRLKTDIQYRICKRLRNRLNRALKNNKKTGSAVKDLGCTINEFKTYLESKFQSGMTWNNWGSKGWHIDHIKPLASFDLTDRQQLLMACHYTNLQPLWAKDNLIKSDKIIF